MRYLIFSFLLSVSCLCVFAQNYVNLYEDCNYRGRSYFLGPGNYHTEQMKVGNDRLSCLQVPAGMKVTIYEHEDFQGRSQTFTSNVACLPPEWNEMASSIVVESNYGPGYNANDYVTFYNDCYSRGYARSLGPGTYSGYELGTLKNNISSFTIYGNLRVRAYMSNENASGYYINFDESQSCMGGSYNDNIKSLVIEYRQGGNYGGWGNNYGGGHATVYTECNYRGNSLRLGPGNYRGDQLGLLRYDISSIELPSNLRARVYINNEFLAGSYYFIDQSSRCLVNNLNNRIGSLVIEERGYGGNNNNYPPYGEEWVIIYTDENYRGQSAALRPGTYYSMAQLGFPDNALSSLTLPPGYRVVLYENENFRGRSYTVNQSKNKFYFSGWNDKTSSIAVYRDR